MILSYVLLVLWKMKKNRLSKLLLVVVIVCLVCISVSAFFLLFQRPVVSEKYFPLEVNLSKNIFNVGEKISFTASIINRFGRDVNMSSNGEQPCVFFYNINDTTARGETCMLVRQVFRANERILRVFEYDVSEAGLYVLEVHYSIVVDDVAIENKLDDIIIEVR